LSFSFGITKVGYLTKKQEKTLEEIEKMCHLFYEEDKSGRYGLTQRTWGELLSLSHVSKGFLSKHLRELISQGVVEKKVNMEPDGKVNIFYTYTEKSFEIHGKAPDPSVLDGARVYYDKNKIAEVEWGLFKKRKRLTSISPRQQKKNVGKDRERYFIPET
jgi:DNA-binding MarR family transcriptional regulator